MISVDEALGRILALAPAPQAERVALADAAGRVLLNPVTTHRSQPPFAASAMDGYAMRAADLADGAVLQVIGAVQAGGRFAGQVAPGEAVRIFTGAPVPAGADHITIQEDVIAEGSRITLRAMRDSASYIRPAGGDFAAGASFAAPKRLSPQDIALLAAMNQPFLDVARRPVVALLPTGDELVNVGEALGENQIISSNNLGLKALVEATGGRARLMPIAPDTPDGLRAGLAACEGADLVVTLGGASVGDHDLVASVGQQAGLALDVYKVAMRPGKPLMAGRLNGVPMLGLPGNPVSAMVCGHVFLVPLLRRMLSLASDRPGQSLPLAHDLGTNGPRRHYMRAQIRDGRLHITPRQDSSLLSVLAEADCLAIQPENSPSLPAGSPLEILPLATRS